MQHWSDVEAEFTGIQMVGSRPAVNDVGGPWLDDRVEAAANLMDAASGAIEIRASSPERKMVARALGKTRDPRAVEPLLELIGENDKSDDVSKVNRAAAAALNELGELSVGPMLEQLNQAGNSWARYWIAMALGSQKEVSVGTLIAYLKDQDTGVVEGAVCSLLSRGGDSGALEPLRELRGRLKTGTYLYRVVEEAIAECG